MTSELPTYPIQVDRLFVRRRNLGLVERFAAALSGKYPRVLLHKIECPCCGKVTFHRAILREDS